MKAPISRLLPQGKVFLFLLLLFVALSQGTQRCTKATAALGEGEVQITAANATRDSDGDLHKYVYLWPEEGFRGVSLQAFTDTGTGPVRLAAWFSKDSLFPAVNTAAWWELSVYVYRYSDDVEFIVHLGDSRKRCVSRVTVDNLQSLELVGYGPSRWRDTEPPPGCPYQRPLGSWTWPQNTPNCTAPPPIPRSTTLPPINEATPTTTTTTAGVVADVAVAVMAAVVVMVVVLLHCRKERRPADEKTSPRPNPTAGAPTEGIHVIENSLYESFEACRDGGTAGAPTEGIHVIENSLYESFEACRDGGTAGAPTEGIHVIENSLYESFEACRDGGTAGAPTEGIHVIENSLYESFEACRDGGTAGAPTEGIHVIENSLYESFEACRDGGTAGAPTEGIHVIENSLYESFEACMDGGTAGEPW
ncbi:uncharacterized protein LOC126989461 [Eriocheir sinensis]|uniref:uncharacterized protein LOC126989461 n=1 Tax=Eriocheir sinensis TaxID=95602 RepID=UPI0021C9B65D|nr:uncharacterized protein LOC126989461 [Eriocheir sinensis]